MTDVPPATASVRLTARALIVGERIDTAGLERPDMISQLPLAFRVGEKGMAALFRFGVMPFLSPAGRGDYSRPQFRVIYVVTSRNQAAKSLYPQNDLFSIHDIEHFLGFGVEWWFNSTSYGG